MSALEWTAAATGVVFGIVSVVIWETASLHLGHDGFWSQFRAFARALVADIPMSLLFRQYLSLLKLSALYSGKKLLTVAITCLPLAVLAVALYSLANEQWHSRQLRFAFLLAFSVSSLAGWIFWNLKKRR